MGVLLSEEVRKQSSWLVEISGSALSVDQRGRPMNKEKKKNDKSKSKLGRGTFRSRGVGCWRCGEKDISRGTASRRMEKEKAKRKIPCMSQSDGSDALILLANSCES